MFEKREFPILEFDANRMHGPEQGDLELPGLPGRTLPGILTSNTLLGGEEKTPGLLALLAVEHPEVQQ